jgi:hypothetical protein
MRINHIQIRRAHHFVTLAVMPQLAGPMWQLWGDKAWAPAIGLDTQPVVCWHWHLIKKHTKIMHLSGLPLTRSSAVAAECTAGGSQG